MDKKGSEKIMSVTFVLYLLLIGTGVVTIVLQYINSPVDVRPMEAEILYNNIMDCISKNGYIVNDVLNDNFNIYSYCHLSKEVLDPSEKSLDHGDYWYNLTFLGEKGSPMRNSISAGNSMYQSDCDVLINKQSSSNMVCLFKNESFILTGKSNLSRIRVTALIVSNSQGARLTNAKK